MKSLEITEANAALKEYAKRLAQGPLVVTRKGKAIAALVRVQPSDLESLLVSENPEFKNPRALLDVEV
jgi:antitoxin (DNA-binding transcriptional repressor) of toxin-antitoxin stability system